MILESGGADQELVDTSAERFPRQNVPQAMPAIAEEREAQSSKVLQALQEVDVSLGKLLSRRARVLKAEALNRDAGRALGRLPSSCYAVTVQEAGIEHAKVASWLTPAPQTSLGMTLAVAKKGVAAPLPHVGYALSADRPEEGTPHRLRRHFRQKIKDAPPGRGEPHKLPGKGGGLAEPQGAEEGVLRWP